MGPDTAFRYRVTVRGNSRIVNDDKFLAVSPFGHMLLIQVRYKTLHAFLRASSPDEEKENEDKKHGDHGGYAFEKLLFQQIRMIGAVLLGLILS
jgi:hypothetical protein